MLYESTYNQYFLEHSWGPWKKHMYISREGESGKFTYKYPREYYEKYEKRRNDKLYKNGNEWLKAYQAGDTEKANALWDKQKKIENKDATRDSEYYNEYYNTGVDKVINRSVKAAVKALNFGVELKGKAEDYLNRFGNAVANAWNTTKSKASAYAQTGKNFVSNLANKVTSNVTVQRISASVKNLIQGAGAAIEETWNDAKKKVTTTADELGRKVRNTVKGVRARAQGAERV